MGGPKYYPSDEHRKQATEMARVGISNKQIAPVLNISEDTLEKYYAQDMRKARTSATAMVAGKLFQKAMEGDNTCMIFWLKTQAQWQEVMRIEQTIEAEVKFKISAKPMTPEEWLEQNRENSLGTTEGSAGSIDYVPTE